MITGFESIDSWYEGPLGRLYLQRVIEKLNGLLNNKEKDVYALDAGCGAGHYTLHLAQSYKTIGVDKSEILISKATKKSNSQGRRVNFLAADLSSLPFRSNFFKLIICLNVIEFVSGRERAIRELKRVLAPDGVLLLGVCNKNSIWGLIKKIAKSFRKKDPFFKGYFFSRSDLIDLANQAGLELEQIREEIYFPPINNKRLALFSEKIGRKYLKRFPGLLIAYLKKPMVSK